jgi:uncharacterized membrane protein
VTFTSWKLARIGMILAAVGFAVHPSPAGAWAAAEAWVDRNRRWVLGGALALFAVYLGGFKTAQHLSLRTGAYDLSMFHHAVHHTLSGKFLHAYGIERNFFSEHFSPLLLVLVPLYAVWSSPLSMLWAQSLGVAAAAIPLYLIARHLGLSRLLALLAVTAFAVNSQLWRGFAFDFHIELFLPLGVFAAVLFGLRGQWLWFHLATLAALTVKEDMVLVMPCAAALVWLYRRSEWKHVLVTVLLCAVWGVLAWKVVIPGSYPDPSAKVSHFVGRYGHLGSSYSEIAISLLTRPGWTLSKLFTPATKTLVESLGYVPLLDPATLVLAVPPVLLHLVSGYDFQASLGVYYGIGAMAFLFLAVPRVMERAKRWKGPLAAAVVGALAIAFEPRMAFWTPPTDRDARAREYVERLGPDERVSAQTTFIPHVLPEAKPRLLEGDVGGATVVLLDLERTTWPLKPAEHRELVRRLLSSKEFGVEARAGGFVALRRGADTGANDATWAELERLPLVKW